MSFGPKLDSSATRICMSSCTTFGVFDLRWVARVKKIIFFNVVHDVLHNPDPDVRSELVPGNTVYNYIVIYNQNTKGNANNRDASANFSKLGRMNRSRLSTCETCSVVLRKFRKRDTGKSFYG